MKKIEATYTITESEMKAFTELLIAADQMAYASHVISGTPELERLRAAIVGVAKSQHMD